MSKSSLLVMALLFALAASDGFGALTGLVQAPKASANSQTQSAQSQLETMHIAYARGEWPKVIASAPIVCPSVDSAFRIQCYVLGIRAATTQALQSDSGVTASVAWAAKITDSLLLAAEPEQAHYSELLLMQGYLLGIQQNLAQAQISYNRTKAALPPERKEALEHLCQFLLRKGAAMECATKPSTPVTLPVATPTTTPLDTDASTPTQQWVLQMGAFGVQANAQILVDNLQKRKINARILERASDTRTLYLVQTLPFADKESALDFGAKVLAPINLEFQPLPSP